MRVLVACEYSGRVRDAFAAKGHYAVSCDILPSESPGHHYQGDIFDILDEYEGQKWDLMIAHPPCQYLSLSGVRWLFGSGQKQFDENGEALKEPVRWNNMENGAAFFKRLMDADIPKIAIENPTMHPYAQELIGQNPTQAIQPWQHGHEETKRTCLWLKGLPEIKPTKIMEIRVGLIRDIPHEDRAKVRSLTYQGIADAMADQWGS